MYGAVALRFAAAMLANELVEIDFGLCSHPPLISLD